MGDRCYMEVDIPEEMEPKAASILDEYGFVEQGSDRGWVNYADSEANYGGTDLVEELEKAGIVYTAWHGTGDNYGPANYAFDGEKGGSIPQLHDSGDALPVEWNSNGYFEVSPGWTSESAANYIRAKAEIDKRFPKTAKQTD